MGLCVCVRGFSKLVRCRWVGKINQIAEISFLYEKKNRIEKKYNTNKNLAGVRNPKEAQKNIESRVDFSDLDDVKIDYLYLDTGNLKSVRQFAHTVQQKYSKIDILINNAGIMAAPYWKTEDGFESQFAVNYLGHFLLTHLLMPQLRVAGTQDLHSRVINVSSCANLVGNINMDDINGT